MKKLEVRFTAGPRAPARLVGTLVDQGGRIYFEYADAWLKTGLNLSPGLPLDGLQRGGAQPG